MKALEEMDTHPLPCAVWDGERKVKGKQIGRPQITVDNLPSGFLQHYPAYKSGHLNISEFARVCDLSRTTIYKYIDLLEGQK